MFQSSFYIVSRHLYCDKLSDCKMWNACGKLLCDIFKFCLARSTCESVSVEMNRG